MSVAVAVVVLAAATPLAGASAAATAAVRDDGVVGASKLRPMSTLVRDLGLQGVAWGVG